MESSIAENRGYQERSITLEGAPVKIVVSTGEQCFFVHSTILTSSSEFFKAALKGEWVEGQEREVKLVDEAAEVFSVYVQWLYTGIIFCKSEGNDDGDNDYLLLAKLYVLGEKLIDASFQDGVMNAMVLATRERDVEGTLWWPGEDAVAVIYQGTSQESPARRLMVDFYVGNGEAEWISKLKDDSTALNHDFLVDLSVALYLFRTDVRAKGFKELKSGKACAYHKHDVARSGAIRRRFAIFEWRLASFAAFADCLLVFEDVWRIYLHFGTKEGFVLLR